MIKSSIIRGGGKLHWQSTLSDVRKIENDTWPETVCIDITAPEKGMGKSTLFEALASKHDNLLAIEGDILSVLARLIIDKPDFDEQGATLSDIARGVAIPGYIPWVNESRKDEYGELLKQRYPNIINSLSLTTSFHGVPSDGRLLIFPDYKWYADNMRRRTEHMVNVPADKSAPAEDRAFRERIREKHKVLSFDQVCALFMKKLENDQLPYAIVPNFSSSFDVVGQSALRTVVAAACLKLTKGEDYYSVWRFN